MIASWKQMFYRKPPKNHVANINHEGEHKRNFRHQTLLAILHVFRRGPWEVAVINFIVSLSPRWSLVRAESNYYRWSWFPSLSIPLDIHKFIHQKLWSFYPQNINILNTWILQSLKIFYIVIVSKHQHKSCSTRLLYCQQQYKRQQRDSNLHLKEANISQHLK